jgi:hypothetical protein
MQSNRFEGRRIAISSLQKVGTLRLLPRTQPHGLPGSTRFPRSTSRGSPVSFPPARSVNSGGQRTGMPIARPTRCASSTIWGRRTNSRWQSWKKRPTPYTRRRWGPSEKSRYSTLVLSNHLPNGLQVGSLTVLWHDEVLRVTTPTESYILNRRQTAELLHYLYHRRGSLLKPYR